MGGYIWTQHTRIHNIQRIHKTLLQKKKKKKRKQLKVGRGCEYIFFQNRHKNGQQTEKMLNITNCQGIETTVRCHFIPFRMAIIKKTSNRCWWGCSEKGTFMHCGIMDWCIQYGKLYDGSSQNENCHMIQHFHIWGFTWKKLKTKIHAPLC